MQCVRETEILVEQTNPAWGLSLCDHAGRVINNVFQEYFFFFFITLGLELSDTKSLRALNTSPFQEYKRRRQCMTLGSDLFLEDLKILRRAEAKARTSSCLPPS